MARAARAMLEPDGDDDRRLVKASELLRALLLQDVEAMPSGAYQIK
jgi:hypothetical protein